MICCQSANSTVITNHLDQLTCAADIAGLLPKKRRPNMQERQQHLHVSKACGGEEISALTKTSLEKQIVDFGSSLPGESVGIEGKVRMIYGGMPFGWCGAPGEYMVFALAGRAVHESHRPAQSTTNGPTAFSSEWLMDDSVSVEPLLGVRPWQAVDCLGHSIVAIWGKRMP